MDGHLVQQGEQNPAYRPTHRHEAFDQGLRLSDPAPDRPSMESAVPGGPVLAAGHT
jgi:hypothetical protein